MTKGDNNSKEWAVTYSASSGMCLNQQGVSNLLCFIPSLGAFHHYAATYVAGTITWYQDGAQVATGSGLAVGNSSSSAFLVGNFPGGGFDVEGDVDDIALWSTALPATEVASLALGWAAPEELPGLVADWAFSEGPGNGVTADSSGNGNTLTLTDVNWAAACGAGIEAPAPSPHPDGGFYLGGTVSGLTGGSVVLGMPGSAAANLILTNNGPFQFPALVAPGAGFSVVVVSGPVGETCSVSQGRGSNVQADVWDIAVTCTTPCAGPPTTFAGPQLSGGYTYFPLGAAVADFNRDGCLDTVVSNPFSGNVNFSLGTCDGGFLTPITVGIGINTPDNQAIGDFNGDGNPDVLVGSQASSTTPGVGLLLGLGTGWFRPAITVDAGLGANFVAAGDFDRDGRLDFAVANANTNTVGVLLGNGDGTFQPQSYYPVGTSPTSMGIVDLRANGILDIVAAGGSTLSVLLGYGDGGFAAAANLPLNGTSLNSVAFGDLDGDGIVDLAGATNDGFAVMHGDGDGTFQPPAGYAIGTAAVTCVLGDFNGDGFLDLVVGTSDYNVGSYIFVFPGSATGPIGSPAMFLGGTIVDEALAISGLAVADFDNDGRLDIAGSDESSFQTLWWMNSCAN